MTTRISTQFSISEPYQKMVHNNSTLGDQKEGATSSGNPLSRSIFGDYYPETKTKREVSAQEARQLGSTVLDRAEKIYHQTKAVRTLVSSATENPTRFGCSVLALVTGLARIYSGDVITGGIATVMGAKELYNQCTSGDTGTLPRLLSDIDADVDMIRILEEGQQQSYNVVEKNLALIQGDVNTLYNMLDEIQALNTEGLTSIEASKLQAHEKGAEAKAAYREALKLFAEVKVSFDASRKTYQKCADYFSRIQEIAQDEESDTPVLEKVDTLAAVAKAASRECATGKREIEAADEKFSQAMQAFSKASALKDEAVVMISRAVQNAEDTLKAGREKAQYTTECTKRIAETQKELEEIKGRSDDVMGLLNEMSNEVARAKSEAGKKLNPSDAVVGIGTGVALSSFGVLTPIVLGVAATYAWHNGTTIANTAKKVYGYFSGVPSIPPKPLERGQNIRINMDKVSSGYYGSWVKGRSSNTLGSVDLKLGDEVVQLRFDLNQSQYPVSKEDLLKLYTTMFAKLKDGTLSPRDCKRALSQLEDISISRGDLHQPTLGLIRRSQAAYGLVKALNQYCKKLSNQKPIAEE